MGFEACSCATSLCQVDLQRIFQWGVPVPLFLAQLLEQDFELANDRGKWIIELEHCTDNISLCRLYLPCQ